MEPKQIVEEFAFVSVHLRPVKDQKELDVNETALLEVNSTYDSWRAPGPGP